MLAEDFLKQTVPSNQPKIKFKFLLITIQRQHNQ